MLRRKFNTQLVAASCAFTSGCGLWKENEKLVRLAIGGSTGLQFLPHIIASELGFYKQNGLEMAAENLAGGSKALRALLGGSADVVAGYFDHPVRISALGRTVQSFAVLNKCPGNVVIVSHLAADRIRSIPQLKDATIGVTDLGSQVHWFVNYLASTHGIVPETLKVVAIGMQANALAALERGTINVWSGVEPGVTRFLTRHPQAVVLADARSPEGLSRIIQSTTYPGAVLYSTKRWLQKYPEKARRLGRAMRSSLQWIQVHTPEEIIRRVPEGYTGKDRGVYREALRNSYGMYSADGLMPPEGPDIALKILSASIPGLRTANFNLNDTWTNEFVDTAH
jgi:NitT/TauT family transport system substrate-binding protein